ncbi:Uncharacterized protein DBV15_06300 [Temnothorax longispinosus]|uniref:Uncharacterized protein n=1 Tax=Temnothorax longispinosus TaxID=300112 RepID=A0A4S2KIJ3_9HYME|nr:Uncharacterized protein DBV15_06300 [Temnothorax longispinosus]
MKSGDLAVAAHHFPGTDSDVDGDDDSVVSDNGGSDEESSEQEIHNVPTRKQLAEQRSRWELFRRSRNHFKTSKHHAQVRPMARLVVARQCCVGEQGWSDDTESMLSACGRDRMIKCVR